MILRISAALAAVGLAVSALWSWRAGAEREPAAPTPSGIARVFSEAPGSSAELSLPEPTPVEPRDLSPEDVSRAVAQDVDPGDDRWTDISLSAYVLEQPPWSEDERYFEEKYATFTRAELKEASRILGWHVYEEATAWVDQRFASGDYVDITDGAGEESRATGMVSRIRQVITPEGLRTLRFDFPEQEYPLIAYRSREHVYAYEEAQMRR